MRDAALMIAALGDDHALSYWDIFRRAVMRLAASLHRARTARRHMRHLRGLDARLLDDLGLTPRDVAGLEPSLSAVEASRRLAEVARRRVAAREERWRRV
ncbi:MAG: DUF1127 domain-containing protein [Siculibacillus sp.]|nr:DUF1127 domain-containing protein [Siculibacillus sp.]